MADRGDTHYRVGTLNRWFAGSSLFLLVVTRWRVRERSSTAPRRRPF